LRKVRDGAGEPAVAGQRDDGFVDGKIRRVVLVDAAGLGVPAQLLVQVFEGGEVGVAGMAGGLVGAASFQQGQHREDLVQVLLGHLVHEAAAPRLVPHQAFCRQYLQRLAQRRAGDLQLLGQLHLVEELARRHRAREDQFAQLRGDFVVQGVVDQAHGGLPVISCNYG
jgi:hypothetical protein